MHDDIYFVSKAGQGRRQSYQASWFLTLAPWLRNHCCLNIGSVGFFAPRFTWKDTVTRYIMCISVSAWHLSFLLVNWQVFCVVNFVTQFSYLTAHSKDEIFLVSRLTHPNFLVLLFKPSNAGIWEYYCHKLIDVLKLFQIPFFKSRHIRSSRPRWIYERHGLDEDESLAQ